MLPHLHWNQCPISSEYAMKVNNASATLSYFCLIFRNFDFLVRELSAQCYRVQLLLRFNGKIHSRRLFVQNL